MPVKKKDTKRAETTGDFVGLVHVHEPLVKSESVDIMLCPAPFPYPV